MPVRYQIQPGGSITSLASQYGLFVDTIWNHPDNAKLKQLRQDMDILMPGDMVYIPDKTIKQVPKPTDQKHIFKRKGVPALFRLQIFDLESPRANQSYVLTVDGKVYQGTTDSSGVLQEYLDPAAQEGEVVIGPDRYKLIVQFGQLDPIDELSGVQKRLSNLGFDCGDATGEMTPATESALRAFQYRFSLPETGKADEATKNKLKEINDNVNQFPPAPAAGSGD